MTIWRVLFKSIFLSIYIEIIIIFGMADIAENGIDNNLVNVLINNINLVRLFVLILIITGIFLWTKKRTLVL